MQRALTPFSGHASFSFSFLNLEGLGMKSFFIIGLICVIAGGGFASDEVQLKSGAKITAPLLKEVDDTLIFDLGVDLLRIPRSEVLSLKTNTPDDPLAEDSPKIGKFFTTDAPENITTADASKRYAPAVVLVKTARGLGSGFFINQEGYLITNFHVIQGEKRITVTQFLQEDQILRRILHKDVEIIAVAPFHDLAVLKISAPESTDITSVIFAPKEELNIGEPVFAIGNPMGLERTVTKGVLSQTHRNFGGILYLQVDAPINPGNSGGPLFNARGQVIGIINMGAVYMDGLNFAIPARHAKYILNHLDAYAYDATNPESGYVYPDAPRRPGLFKTNLKENNHAD